MDSKSILPKTIRANGGSSIQLISIKNGRIVWIDSLNFFAQSLAKLPQTYGIVNSEKGYFPHGFNTTANEEYEGDMPDIKYYHPEYRKILNGKGQLDYTEHKKLIDWYNKQVADKVAFNLRNELIKYCIDDCKVLLKAVLIFRNLVMNENISSIINDDGVE